MRQIESKYLVAENPIDDRRHGFVIQTGNMQLVGAVSVFTNADISEAARRRFLDNRNDPHFYAKAPGYRVYISLHSTLVDGGIPQGYIVEHKEEVHDILREMAIFYVERMPSKLKRNAADVIADDTAEE